MNTKLVYLFALLLIFSSCGRYVDNGDYQEGNQSYALRDFTKVQIGSASKVTVLYGSDFSISARGDVRNLADLQVFVSNGTLIAQYMHPNRSRRYPTDFTITMPALQGVHFSGATTASVSGFSGMNSFDVHLSGGSNGTFNLQTTQCYFDISGGSRLTLLGNSTQASSEISGGSTLESYSFAVQNWNLNSSGGSIVKVNAQSTLNVQASGGSRVRYVGSASVVSNLSGGSTLTKE